MAYNPTPLTDVQLRAAAAGVVDVSAGDLLANILVELRVISTLLQVGLSVSDDPTALREDLTRTTL